MVRLSLIYSSAIVAITMAIDRACSPALPRSCSWPMSMEKKEKEASIVS